MIDHRTNSITVTVAVVFAFTAATVSAADYAPGLSKADAKLPEKIEILLEDLADKAVKLKRDSRSDDMKRIITEVAEVAAISEEQRKKLEEEAKAVVEHSLEGWKNEFGNRLRPYLKSEGDDAIQRLEQWPAEQLVRSGFPGDFNKPEDEPRWKDALKKTLSPEQFKALDKIAGDRERKLEKDIADYAKPFVEQAVAARASMLATEVEELKTTLGISEEKITALQAKVKDSADRAGEAAKKRIIKMLKAMPEQQRNAVIASKRNRIMAGDQVEEEGDDIEPEETSDGIWKKAVTEFLSESERKQWETMSRERTDRAARALTMMFIAEMDRCVLFSEDQRRKLEPLGVKAFAEKAKNMTRNESITVMMASMFETDAVKAVLDAGQWTRWEAASRGEIIPGRRGGMRVRRHAVNGGEDKKAEEKPAATTAKLLSDEEMFSNFFEKHQEEMRDRLDAQIEGHMKDVCRVVSLEPAQAKYLEVAAKGAVERSMDNWRSQYESWVRNSVERAKGTALQNQLESLEEQDVWFGDDAQPGQHSIWKDALVETLTPVQKKAWEGEIGARVAYRKRAYSWGILGELNKRLHFSSNQFDRLDPLVQTAVDEYYEDYQNIFGRGTGNVMPRYLITLFAGVPEDKAQEILTPAQMKQWKENELKSLTGWWNSIKSSHQSRQGRPVPIQERRNMLVE